MNAYVLYFPRMNLGRSTNAAADVDADRAYLDRFRTQWAIGAGWWTTIEAAQRLYERASRDRDKFFGKTRSDFLALEAMINHSTSNFPAEMETDTQGGSQDRLRDPPATSRASSANDELGSLVGNHSVSEVMGLRDLNQCQPQMPQHDPILFCDGNGNEWNAIWPLWEDQLGISFQLESAPWDYAANSASAV